MVAKTEDFDIDFFDRPIPGQSFTDAQGKNPYESQPMVTSPEQAMNLVEESLEHPAAYENILNLLDAGISSETIASALVLKMFSEGVFTPDVAEIIKPPLIAVITDLGMDAGVEDVNVVNSVPQDAMSTDQSYELMQQVNPEKYNRIMNDYMRQEEEMELASQIELPPEEEPVKESFLDMEAQ